MCVYIRRPRGNQKKHKHLTKTNSNLHYVESDSTDDYTHIIATFSQVSWKREKRTRSTL